jgi:two-component system, NarL family, nitrate/nitrite response regulator NarL
MKPTRIHGVDETPGFVASGSVKLSARETEIARQIGEGKSSKEIAVHLGISAKTVESHRTNLFRKLRCRSIVDLRYAIRHGLVKL